MDVVPLNGNSSNDGTARQQWTSGDSDMEDLTDLEELEQPKFDTKNLKVGDLCIPKVKLPDVKRKYVQYIGCITEIRENDRYELSFFVVNER